MKTRISVQTFMRSHTLAAVAAVALLFAPAATFAQITIGPGGIIVGRAPRDGDPVLAAGAVVTTVRNGGTNAPPKDGGATACRTFAAGWAGLALPAFTVTAPATSARWAGPAMPNADSGGLNVN